ncbi:hypothetical protein O6A27_25545 [Escherichia coli]|nr:hypothetical protein [Escherichia coli]
MLPSETMIWQPEFTDKTPSGNPGRFNVICSTSIERIVTGRNAALTQIGSIAPPD